MKVIAIYVLICVGVWAILMVGVEKFFRYLDQTELPEVPDFVDETGKEYYGY